MFQGRITIDVSSTINTNNDIVFEVRFSSDSPQNEDRLCEKFLDDILNPLRKLVQNNFTEGSEKVMQIRITDV